MAACMVGVMTEGIKACSKCKVDYCLEEFYPRRDRDGYSSWCKFCIRSSHNARGKRQRDKYRSAFLAGTVKPIEEKWCIICDDVKPSKEFYMKWDSPDLLSKYCRKCHIAANTTRERGKRKSNAQRP